MSSIASVSATAQQTAAGGIQNDAANFLLTSLFGPGWENIVTQSGGAVYSSTLFTMFELFNSTVLLGVGVLMVWTIVSGVAGAAYEGKSMGDKGVNLWTPTRMAYSIALLAPIPGIGISSLQAVVLAMVLSSVNLANDLLDKTISVMGGGVVSAGKVTEGGAGAQVRPLTFDMDNNYQEVSKEAFQMVFMANAASKTGSVITSSVGSYSQDAPSSLSLVRTTLLSQYRMHEWNISGDSGHVIGNVQLKCSPEDGGLSAFAICQAKANAFNTMIKALDGISRTYVSRFDSGTVHPETSIESCPEIGGVSVPYKACVGHKIKEAANAYLNSIATSMSVLNNAGGEYQSAWSKNVTELQADIKKGGFVLLGSYYWRITKLNQMINSALKTEIERKFSIKAAMSSANSSYGSGGAERVAMFQKENTDFERNYVTSSTNAALMDSIQNSSNSKSADASMGRWFQAHYTAAVFGSSAATAILGGKEPIATLQNLGLGIISATDGFIAIAALWDSTGKSAKETAKGVANATGQTVLGWFGSGVVAQVVAGAVTVASNMLSSYLDLFMKFSGILISSLAVAAFFLAFYLPVLPTILWLLAIMGWLILVIEAMVAAPVWAAAHAIPEGEGIAGQHGKQGYMMLLNVLLRPALMVFGFMIAIALVNSTATLAAYMIGEGVISSKTGLGGHGIGGPFAFLMSLVSSIVLVTVTMIIVIHKTFTLVTWLPENVIKWAGGHGSGLGEEGDERRVAGVFATVGNQASMAGKGDKPSNPGAGDGGDDGAKAKEEGKDDAKQVEEAGPKMQGNESNDNKTI